MAIPMDENRFLKIKKKFEVNGGAIDSSPDIDRHLDMMESAAATLNENTILIRQNEIPSTSALLKQKEAE